jgi:hypothetical protein
VLARHDLSFGGLARHDLSFGGPAPINMIGKDGREHEFTPTHRVWLLLLRTALGVFAISSLRNRLDEVPALKVAGVFLQFVTRIPYIFLQIRRAKDFYRASQKYDCEISYSYLFLISSSFSHQVLFSGLSRPIGPIPAGLTFWSL